MRFAFSVNGFPIRLTPERLQHIVNHHPELLGDEHRILEGVNNPDLVQKGDAGTLLAIKRFDKTPVTENKYLVVVYRETAEFDGFVLTAYYQSSLRQRVIIWKL